MFEGPSYRSSCRVDLWPMALCWRAGLCLAELAPDGGPLYSENIWYVSNQHEMHTYET